MTAPETLLPCLRCGDAVRVLRHQPCRDGVHIPPVTFSWNCVHESCRISARDFTSMEAAIEHANRRPTPTPIPEGDVTGDFEAWLSKANLTPGPEKEFMFTAWRAGRVWYGTRKAAVLIPYDQAVGAPSCGWLEDSDGTWNTECGEAFVFTNDGPKENNFKFCHGCGKWIDTDKYIDPVEKGKVVG